MKKQKNYLTLLTAILMIVSSLSIGVGADSATDKEEIQGIESFENEIAFAEEFLSRRAYFEFMNDDTAGIQLLKMMLAEKQHPPFFWLRNKYFSEMRKAVGIQREDLVLNYQFLSITRDKEGIVKTKVKEIARFRYTDTRDEESFIENEMELFVAEKYGVYYVLDAVYYNDWFTSEYKDAELTLEDIIAMAHEENDEKKIEYALAPELNTKSTTYTYRLYNKQNGVNYAKTYRSTNNTNFKFYTGADCQNFASQCVYAGFSGSDDSSVISNKALPMDNGGTYKWYGAIPGGSAVSSWTSCSAFKTYLDNSRTASQTGIRSDVYTIAENGTIGSPLTASDLPGAVFHVKGGSGTDFGHAIVIVQATSTARSGIYYNAHNPNTASNLKLSDLYNTCKLRIMIPKYFYEYSTCTSSSHTFSVNTDGTESGTCSNLGCGYVRLFIRQKSSAPVSAGSSVSLGGYANFGCYKLYGRVYSPSGSVLYALPAVYNTNSISKSYTFASAGLYKVVINATDLNPSAYSSSITREVVYYVRVG